MPSAVSTSERVTTAAAFPAAKAVEFQGVDRSTTPGVPPWDRNCQKVPPPALGHRGHEHPKGCEQQQTQETGPTRPKSIPPKTDTRAGRISSEPSNQEARSMKTRHGSRRFRRFVKANEAVSALEYAILAGVVSLAVGGAIITFSGDITAAIEGVGDGIAETTGGELKTGKALKPTPPSP